jgi:hypothetical protein
MPQRSMRSNPLDPAPHRDPYSLSVTLFGVWSIQTFLCDTHTLPPIKHRDWFALNTQLSPTWRHNFSFPDTTWAVGRTAQDIDRMPDYG